MASDRQVSAAVRRINETISAPGLAKEADEMRELLRAVLRGEDVHTDRKWMRRALALTR